MIEQEKKFDALFGLKGWLEIRDNKTKELLRVVKNTIVNNGLAICAFQLGDGTTPLIEACVGSGNTAAEITNSALETFLGMAAPTFSRVQTAVANDTAQFVSVHTAGADGWAVKEYGIRTAADILFNRVVFAVINLAQGNELEFTYKIQVTRVV